MSIIGTLAVLLLWNTIPIAQDLTSNLPKVAEKPFDPSQESLKDERLQKRISPKFSCLSLTTFSEYIYEKTEVHLRVSPTDGNNKIQICLKDRTLSEIMTSLSELYGGTWTKKDKDFYFEIRPEITRKKTSWWYAVEAERKKNLSNISQQFRNAMNAHKPDWRKLQGLSGSELFGSQNSLYQTQFWYDLPPVLQEGISESFSDNYSYPRYRFVLPIISEGGPVWPIASLPNSCLESLLNQLGQSNPGISRSQITSFFIKNGSRSLHVCVTVKGLGADGKQVSTGSTGISLQCPTIDETSLFGLDHRNLQATLEKQGKQPSLYQKRLIDFQSQTFWDNDLSKSNKHAGPKYNYTGFTVTKNDGTPQPSASDIKRDSALPRLSDKLGKLTSKIEFIADYYSIPYRPLTKEEWDANVGENVENDLNDIAKEYDCSWKKQPNNVFLVRNNRWYREDNLEVPMKIADTLEKLSEQAKHLSFPAPDTAEIYCLLEMASVAATRLSKWQIANGLYYYTREERVPPYAPAVSLSPSLSGKNTPFSYLRSLYDSDCQPYTGVAVTALLYNKTCRFYASLAYPERVKLLTTGIRLGDLSPTQEELLVAISPEAASMSDSSLVRFKGSSIGVGPINPYLYGAKSLGPFPFQIQITYLNGDLSG